MTTRPTLPLAPSAALQLRPYGDADGAVIAHAGRYARECVLLAFEMIGGVERMAEWATSHPTEFYTRLFTKVITKEVEITASQGVEDLLARLDTLPSSALRTEPQEAEYEIAYE